MATVEPSLRAKRALWRAVMRTVKVIPRHLDTDLIRGAGLTASEYTTIMHLSEAPTAVAYCGSGQRHRPVGESDDRLVDDLQSRGLVTKTASSSESAG